MSSLRVMHALLLTYDADVEATIGCLSAYGRAWPCCPLLFVVPVNEERTRSTIEAAVQGVKIAFVQSEKDVSSTLRALLHSTKSDWVYFCNSDRFPAAFPRLDCLEDLTRCLSAQPCEGLPCDLNAIRLFRWREIDEPEHQQCTFAANEFSIVRTQMIGFYHHQFIRKRLLEDLCNSREIFSDIYDFHEHLMSRPELLAGVTLLPETPIAKFGETTIGGKFTLNFAASIGRERSASLDVEPRTKAFTSPVTPATNRFWREEGLAWQEVLNEGAPEAKTVVASFSLACLDEVRQTSTAAEVATTHRRIPFQDKSSVRAVFYLFEDPREVILEIFDAVRTGRTSMSSYFKQAQVSDPPPEQTRALAAFLDQGVDLFRLEEHLDFWLYGARSYEITFVRRETLSAETQACDALAGLPLERMRGKGASYALTSPELQRGIDKIYLSFARRLASLPDVFTA